MRLAYGLLGLLVCLTCHGDITAQSNVVDLVLLTFPLLSFVQVCPLLLVVCALMALPLVAVEGLLLLFYDPRCAMYLLSGPYYHCWFLDRRLYNNGFTSSRVGPKLQLNLNVENYERFQVTFSHRCSVIYFVALLTLMPTGSEAFNVYTVFTNLNVILSFTTNSYILWFIILMVAYLTKDHHISTLGDFVLFALSTAWIIYNWQHHVTDLLVALVYLVWYYSKQWVIPRGFCVLLLCCLALVDDTVIFLWWWRKAIANYIISLLPLCECVVDVGDDYYVLYGGRDDNVLAILMGFLGNAIPESFCMLALLKVFCPYTTCGPNADGLTLLGHPRAAVRYWTCLFSGLRIEEFIMYSSSSECSELDCCGCAFWQYLILTDSPILMSNLPSTVLSFRHVDGRFMNMVATDFAVAPLDLRFLSSNGVRRLGRILRRATKPTYRFSTTVTAAILRLAGFYLAFLLNLHAFYQVLIGILVYLFFHVVLFKMNYEMRHEFLVWSTIKDIFWRRYCTSLFNRFYVYRFHGVCLFSLHVLIWFFTLVVNKFSSLFIFLFSFWMCSGLVGSIGVDALHRMPASESGMHTLRSMSLNGVPPEDFYNYGNEVCDWWCQLKSETQHFEILVYGSLTLTVFYYYLWFVYRVSGRWIITLLALCSIIAIQAAGLHIGVVVCFVSLLINVCICRWFDHMMVVDMVLLLSIYVPISTFMLLLNVLPQLAAWEYLLQSLSLLKLHLMIFISGCLMGVVAFVEIKTADWARAKVIIQRDALTGRIERRWIKFGWLGSLLFGMIGGEIAGCITCAQQKMDSGWSNQTDLVRRYAHSSTADGVPTRSFVKQLMENAKMLGKLDEFLDALNSSEPVDSSCVFRLKSTMDPRALGVIKIRLDGDYQPVANAFIANINGKQMCVCNAHSVCKPEQAQKIFISMQDQDFISFDDMKFSNGHEESRIEVLTWSAQSDIAICTLLTSLNVTPLEFGPIYVGKPYTWMGVAPPLDDPRVHFIQPIQPMPYGLVNCKHNQLGDSGSILLDSNCRVVAMKYGIRTEGGNLTNLAYFVPTHGLKYMNLIAQKIQAASLVDMKKAMEDHDYQEFVKQFLNTTDDIWMRFEDAARNKSKREVDQLLKELGEAQANAKSVQKMLLGQLMYERGKQHILRDRVTSSPDYINLLKQKADLQTQIEALLLLIDKDDEDKKNDPIYHNYIAKYNDYLDLKRQLDNLYPVPPERRELMKQLGQLGAKKSEVKQKLKELVEGADNQEIQQLKQVLKRLNDVISKCAESINEAKWNMNVLIEEDLLSSRMPVELQRVRYPYYYQDEEKKWHVWFSDTEEVIVDKHPCFAKEIIERHEEFGFTRSGFRKKLQHCHVTKAWHDLVSKVQQSNLIHYIYKKIVGEVCPFMIACQSCGHVILCDKKVHVGCSKYLMGQLERHLQTCPMNVGVSKEILINGQIYILDGFKIKLGDVTCGDQDDHKCYYTSVEFDRLDKFKKKMHQYYHVKRDGLNLYVRKKCVAGFNLNLDPIQPSTDKEIEFVKIKSEFDSKLNKLNSDYNEIVLKEQQLRHRQIDDVVIMMKGMFDTVKKELESIKNSIKRHDVSEKNILNKLTTLNDEKNSDILKEVNQVLDDCLQSRSMSPKPQRIKKRLSTRPLMVEAKVNNVNNDREQLFLANANGQHDKLVEDCNCPRCACEADCECELCGGRACIWCNKLGHATKNCPYAKKRECPHCNGFVSNWYGKCIFDPNNGKYGTDTLCCTKELTCIVCNNGGHHSLACPVVRHSTYCKDPNVVNFHGLNNTLLDTMLLPPQDWVQVVNGKREMKRAVKERKPRLDPH